MRKLIIAASALAFAGPAVAQEQRSKADEEIVRSLPRPDQIEEVAETVGRVTDAVMDVPVGPIAQAIDPARRMSRRERDRTLGDVATRDDPYARERIRDSVEAVTYGLGDMVERLAVLTPVLRRTLEDTADRVDDALRTRNRDRDYRYDPDGVPPRD